MGLFGNRERKLTPAQDLAQALATGETVGSVYVLSPKKHDLRLSNYDEHTPALLKLGKKYGTDEIPAYCALDTKSAYEHSIGVYVDRVQVAWVLKARGLELAEILERLAPGSRIAGTVQIWSHLEHGNATVSGSFFVDIV